MLLYCFWRAPIKQCSTDLFYWSSACWVWGFDFWVCLAGWWLLLLVFAGLLFFILNPFILQLCPSSAFPDELLKLPIAFVISLPLIWLTDWLEGLCTRYFSGRAELTAVVLQTSWVQASSKPEVMESGVGATGRPELTNLFDRQTELVSACTSRRMQRCTVQKDMLKPNQLFFCILKWHSFSFLYLVI